MPGDLRACVYGMAVGDALGVPFEFKRRGTFRCESMVGHGTHDQPAGTWSDDTSMALAMCDSYRELGRVDPADVRERFRLWFRRGDYTVDGLFDIGNTTVKALASGRGMAGERDNGNGGLMRCAPMAFMSCSDADVEATCAVTHANPTSTGACVRTVRAARGMAAGESPQEAVPEADRIASMAEDDVRSGGYVLDTETAAYWCLLTTGSYRDCVLKAVNLGDDTDTTAAVAGALAGIVYGIDAIPREWMGALRGKDVIDGCLF